MDGEMVREDALGQVRRWLASLDGAPSAEDVLGFAEGFAGPRSPLPASGDVVALVADVVQREALPNRDSADALARVVLSAVADAGLLRREVERVSLLHDDRPPVPPLREKVDALVFAKLEAVAARAAHAAAEQSSLSGWALAEYVEAQVRTAMRGYVSQSPDEPADGECRSAAGAARAGAREPDLVSRMVDARDCLAVLVGREMDADVRGAVAGAARWLDEGIEEGMVQRELYGALRQLVAGEPHVCTCGETREGEGDGCSRGFDDRCRFEAALRSLLGVGEEEPYEAPGDWAGAAIAGGQRPWVPLWPLSGPVRLDRDVRDVRGHAAGTAGEAVLPSVCVVRGPGGDVRRFPVTWRPTAGGLAFETDVIEARIEAGSQVAWER